MDSAHNTADGDCIRLSEAIMECHKTIKGYSVRIKLWHSVNDDGTMLIHRDISYTHLSKDIDRDRIPLNILVKFDELAIDCYWDYLEEIDT